MERVKEYWNKAAQGKLKYYLLAVWFLLTVPSKALSSFFSYTFASYAMPKATQHSPPDWHIANQAETNLLWQNCEWVHSEAFTMVTVPFLVIFFLLTLTAILRTANDK